MRPRRSQFIGHPGRFGFALLAMLAGCTLAPYVPPAKTAASGMETGPRVPRLTVALDCGNCKVRPGIAAIIAESYAITAAKAGAKIDTGAAALVTVVAYTERSDAARALAGPLAGKDEIRAIVTYRDKQAAIADHYYNSWLGIEDIADNLGEMAFDVVRQHGQSAAQNDLGR